MNTFFALLQLCSLYSSFDCMSKETMSHFPPLLWFFLNITGYYLTTKDIVHISFLHYKCIFVQYLNDFLLVCNKAFSGKPMVSFSVHCRRFRGFHSQKQLSCLLTVWRDQNPNSKQIYVWGKKSCGSHLSEVFLFEDESRFSLDQVSGVSYGLKKRKKRRRKEVNYSFLNPFIVV